MKLIRNAVGISKLLLILLLVIVFIVGAVLSYMWTMGYYISLGLRTPEAPTITITNATFDPQNPTFFNLTLLNPSFSPFSATVTQIMTSTEDGDLYYVRADPELPVDLPISESKTLRCSWNWSDYTGENLKIHVFVADGSGAVYETKTPLVDLTVEAVFNSTISVTHFNVTVQNSPSSVTYVNITNVKVDTETVQNVTLSIHPSDSVSFTCLWNWTDYQGKAVTVTVDTSQGYAAHHTLVTPQPVLLEITNVLFDITDTSPYFNVTVQNSAVSPTYVNVTGIEATVENGVPLDVTEITPSLPYGLSRNQSQEFMCYSNWTGYRDKNVTISVHTRQGFTKYRTEVTPAPLILEITAVQFSPINATRLNITVRNSRISLVDVNITHITVTVEDGTPENITEITPPYLLHTNESKTFACTWNWGDYGGRNATFTAYAVGYSANATELVPEPVIVITDVVFDPADPTHFNVTVKNPPLSPKVANVTNITVTVEGGITENITEITPSLPYGFNYTEVTFTCSWNWTDYLGKKVTVSVVALPGYAASYTQSIPKIALIKITSVVFNITDTTHFNVTILNPANLTYAHLTYITATLEDGAVQNVTVVGPPYLPHILHPNQSVTFTCLWNWTEYCGQNVTINVNTLRGYVASYRERVPPIIIEVTNVLFDVANTTYFNATVRNSEFSVEEANITKITVTMENGTTIEITQAMPFLPHMLSPNSSVTFECSWNWTNYRDKNVTITVYTLEGYKTFLLSITPP